ncbi:MAG: ABC transporter permease [Chloroflexia bacterium]|jgi:ABC-2 type transport system permease protein|nr:ABC transporter permease [Chloroflexia bacterium]
MSVNRHWTEFRYLFVVQLLEERGFLAGTIFFTTVFPLLLVFGLGVVGDGQSPDGLTYIITGSAVSSLTFVGITMVAQSLAWMKERGDFLYYASLPISKSSLLLAVIASKLVLQMPGIVVALVGGGLLYGLDFELNPLLLIILPLTALALSGMGAALGLLSPSLQLVNLLSQVAGIVVLFAAPVMIPMESLPLPLQWFGRLLPPTYAADALRRAVAGVTDVQLLVDLAVLAFAAALSLVGISRGLRWRLR